MMVNSHHLLQTILKLQVVTLRKVIWMADDLQAQIDSAFAGVDTALAGLSDRVSGIEMGLRDELTKLTDANTKLTDELAAAGVPAPPPIDVSGALTHLQHLAEVADAIDAASPGTVTSTTVTLDPASSKPLYTKNDPQISGDTTWVDASVAVDVYSFSPFEPG